MAINIAPRRNHQKSGGKTIHKIINIPITAKRHPAGLPPRLKFSPPIDSSYSIIFMRRIIRYRY
jgi:hypothetical protein